MAEFTKKIPEDVKEPFERTVSIDVRTVTYIYNDGEYARHTVKVGEDGNITGGTIEENAISLEWYEDENFIVKGLNELPEYNHKGSSEPLSNWTTRQSEGKVIIGKEETDRVKLKADTSIKENIIVYSTECPNDRIDKDYNIINHYCVMGRERTLNPICGPYCPTHANELYGNSEEEREKRFLLDKSHDEGTKWQIKNAKEPRVDFSPAQKAAIFKENFLRYGIQNNNKGGVTYFIILDDNKRRKMVCFNDLLEIKNAKKTLEIANFNFGHASPTKKLIFDVINGKEVVYKVKDDVKSLTSDANSFKLVNDDETDTYKSDYKGIEQYEQFYDDLCAIIDNLEEGVVLNACRSSTYPPPINEGQIDHIRPTKSTEKPYGSISYCNAALISRILNQRKLNFTLDTDDDWKRYEDYYKKDEELKKKRDDNSAK